MRNLGHENRLCQWSVGGIRTGAISSNLMCHLLFVATTGRGPGDSGKNMAKINPRYVLTGKPNDDQPLGWLGVTRCSLRAAQFRSQALAAQTQ